MGAIARGFARWGAADGSRTLPRGFVGSALLGRRFWFGEFARWATGGSLLVRGCCQVGEGKLVGPWLANLPLGKQPGALFGAGVWFADLARWVTAERQKSKDQVACWGRPLFADFARRGRG